MSQPPPDPGAHQSWPPPDPGGHQQAPPQAGGEPHPVDPSWALPPPPPPPSQPERPPVNRFAIAALVSGIVAPCCGGILAVVFGVLALVQIKRTGQRGRGLAIGGLVAAGVWVLAAAVTVVVIAVTSGADRDSSGQITGEGRVPVSDLRPGDCVTDLDEGRLVSVPAVPCAEAHDGEVVGVFDLPAGDWPGDEAVFSQAETGCLDVLRDYSPTAYDDQTVAVFYVHPTEVSWRQGDRQVVCIAQYPDGPRTGSIRE